MASSEPYTQFRLNCDCIILGCTFVLMPRLMFASTMTVERTPHQINGVHRKPEPTHLCFSLSVLSCIATVRTETAGALHNPPRVTHTMVNCCRTKRQSLLPWQHGPDMVVSGCFREKLRLKLQSDCITFIYQFSIFGFPVKQLAGLA